MSSLPDGRQAETLRKLQGYNRWSVSRNVTGKEVILAFNAAWCLYNYRERA
jgi:hypothetical protein